MHADLTNVQDQEDHRYSPITAGHESNGQENHVRCVRYVCVGILRVQDQGNMKDIKGSFQLKTTSVLFL